MEIGISDWITPANAIEAAKKGLLPALLCTEEHWRQLAEASDEELMELLKFFADPTEYISGDCCAMCQFVYDTPDKRHNLHSAEYCKERCLLWDEAIDGGHDYCCGDRWMTAKYYMRRQLKQRSSGEIIIDFHEAATVMYEYIKSVRESQEKSEQVGTQLYSN